MGRFSFHIPPDWLKWTGVTVTAALLISALLGAAADPLPLASFLLQSGLWLTIGVLSLSILLLGFLRTRKGSWKAIWLTAGLALLLLIGFIGTWDKILLPIYHWLNLSRFETWLFPAAILALIYLLFSIPALWRGAYLDNILEKLVALYLSLDSQGMAYEHLRRLYYRLTGREPAISARYVNFLGRQIGTNARLLENTLLELEIQFRLKSLPSHGNGLQKTIPPEIAQLFQKTSNYRQVLSFHITPNFLPNSPALNALTSALLWLENRAEIIRIVRWGVIVKEAERRSLGEILQKFNSADLPSCSPIQQSLFSYLQKNETPCIETLVKMKYEEDNISHRAMRLALQVRLDELSEEDDYQALAQFGNRFLKTPHAQNWELSTIAHRFIGLAWWDQACHFSKRFAAISLPGPNKDEGEDKVKQDTAGELILLLYQKATQHWMSARWDEALDVLKMPGEK